jgi:hypothetical protein
MSRSVVGCVLALSLAACATPAGPTVAPAAPARPHHASPSASPAQIATGTCVWDTGQLMFDRPGLWTFYRDGVARPVHGNASLTLLPDNLNDTAVAVFYNGQVRPPFKLSFLYTIYDDAAPRDPTHAGNGLAALLLKDEAPYRRGDALPIGAGRGVIRDGTGYAVELSLDGPRELRITDGDGQVLASRAFPRAYTGMNSLSFLDISVTDDGISVSVGGKVVLAWHGKVDHRHGGLAISAATSDRDAVHSIADVWLTPEPPLPPGVTLCHDDRPGLE